MITFKDFCKFCNARWHDSKWGMEDAMLCMHILEEMRQYEIPKWKFWKWNEQKRKQAETLEELGPVADEYINKWIELFGKDNEVY